MTESRTADGSYGAGTVGKLRCGRFALACVTGLKCLPSMMDLESLTSVVGLNRTTVLRERGGDWARAKVAVTSTSRVGED